MQFQRKHLVNAVLFLGIVLFVFTPFGFHVKVWVTKLLAGNPSVVTRDEQVSLTNFHWSLVDTNGSAFDLESKKGEVILINFWATWCPPCVAELPMFQQLVDDYGAEMSFFFVAEDTPDKVQAFMQKKEYRFPVFYANGKTPTELYSSSIPLTYIIDRQGKIVVKTTGAADWNSPKVRQLLDELLSAD